MHIIGAGISGLSAACFATNVGTPVELYESSRNAGGRCRSFFDKTINDTIDNGNHLIFSANTNFLELCKIISAENKYKKYKPHFNFFDYASMKEWTFRLPYSYFPWWIFFEKYRIPNTNLKDYVHLSKLFFLKKEDTVENIFSPDTKLFKMLLEPLTLGILNTDTKNASAYLLWNVLKKTFLKGGKFCEIYQPKLNWSDSLINPCLNFLKRKSSKIIYGQTLRNIDVENNHVTKISFNNYEKKIKKTEEVIIAIPPSNFEKIYPIFKLPNEYNTIINIHFKFLLKTHKQIIPIIGLINSKTHWIFIKHNCISVTISSANQLNDTEPSKLAQIVLKEVRTCLKIDQKSIPLYKILKEKKATYNQSPKNNNLIKKINMLPQNLKIAGDWTESNFPSTIETSILSGKNSLKKNKYL